MKTFDKQEKNIAYSSIRGYFATSRPDIQGKDGPVLLWEVAIAALMLICFILLPYLLTLYI